MGTSVSDPPPGRRPASAKPLIIAMPVPTSVEGASPETVESLATGAGGFASMAAAYSEISRRMGSRVLAVVDLTAATESAAAVRVRLATRFIASTN